MVGLVGWPSAHSSKNKVRLAAAGAMSFGSFRPKNWAAPSMYLTEFSTASWMRSSERDDGSRRSSPHSQSSGTSAVTHSLAAATSGILDRPLRQFESWSSEYPTTSAEARFEPILSNMRDKRSPNYGLHPVAEFKSIIVTSINIPSGHYTEKIQALDWRPKFFRHSVLVLNQRSTFYHG